MPPSREGEGEVLLRLSAEGAQQVQASIDAVRTALGDLGRILKEVQEQQQKQTTGLGDATRKVQAAAGEAARQLQEDSRQGAQALGGFVERLRDLQIAYTRAQGASTSLGGALSLLTSAFRLLTTPIGLATTGAVMLAGAFVGIQRQAANTAHELYQSARALSHSSGLSIEASDALISTFKLAGLSTDALAFALFRLSGEIDEGGKRLRQLGIELRDADGTAKTVGQVFLELRDRLSEMGSAAQRNAVLTDVYGRVGRQLIPLMQLSRERFADLTQRAQENAKWTESLTEKTKEYRLALAELSQKWEGFWLTIAPAALDVMTKIARQVGAIGSGMREMAQSIVDATTRMSQLEAARRAAAAALAGPTAPPAQPRALEADEQEALERLQRARGYRRPTPEPGSIVESVRRPPEEVEALTRQIQEAMRTDERMARTIESIRQRQRSEVEVITDEDRRVNEVRLRLRADTLDKLLLAEARYFADLRKLQTQSDQEGLQAQMEANERRIRVEEERYATLQRLIQQLRVFGRSVSEQEREANETTSRIMQLSQEQRSLRLSLYQSDVADHRRALEEKIANERLVVTQMAALLEMERDERLADLNRRAALEPQVFREIQEVQEDAARSALRVRQDQIDSEIAGLRRLAEAHKESGEVQAEVFQRINGLQNDRFQAEVETNRKIFESRKELAEKQRGLALEEAAFGGDVIAAAQARLEKRGLKGATAEQINLELFRMAQSAARAAEQLERGGYARFEDIGLMRQIGPIQERAAGLGTTIQESIRAFGRRFLRPEEFLRAEPTTMEQPALPRAAVLQEQNRQILERFQQTASEIPRLSTALGELGSVARAAGEAIGEGARRVSEGLATLLRGMAGRIRAPEPEGPQGEITLREGPQEVPTVVAPGREPPGSRATLYHEWGTVTVPGGQGAPARSLLEESATPRRRETVIEGPSGGTAGIILRGAQEPSGGPVRVIDVTPLTRRLREEREAGERTPAPLTPPASPPALPPREARPEPPAAPGAPLLPAMPSPAFRVPGESTFRQAPPYGAEAARVYDVQAEQRMRLIELQSQAAQSRREYERLSGASAAPKTRSDGEALAAAFSADLSLLESPQGGLGEEFGGLVEAIGPELAGARSAFKEFFQEMRVAAKEFAADMQGSFAAAASGGVKAATRFDDLRRTLRYESERS